MASKRQLKKALNEMIVDVVDESYSAQLYDEKKAEKSNAVIDESIEFLNSTLTKINNAKNKADFRAIVAEIENKADDLFDKATSL